MTQSAGPLDKKLLGDTAWNYSAFVLMAGTGVALNFFIAAHFGAAALGQFNQIYAVYIVAAQVAVFGIFVFQNQVCMGTMPNFVVEDDCRRIYRKIHCGQPGYIR